MGFVADVGFVAVAGFAGAAGIGVSVMTRSFAESFAVLERLSIVAVPVGAAVDAAAVAGSVACVVATVVGASPRITSAFFGHCASLAKRVRVLEPARVGEQQKRAVVGAGGNERVRCNGDQIVLDEETADGDDQIHDPAGLFVDGQVAHRAEFFAVARDHRVAEPAARSRRTGRGARIHRCQPETATTSARFRGCRNIKSTDSAND